MKHLTTLMILTLLFLAAGVLAAEKPLPNNLPTISQEVPRYPVPVSMTFLRLDPMLEEMEIILKEMREREDELLDALLAATDEKQTDRLIQRLERLDTDRELALLKVQARYARLDRRFDLEKEIKGKILKILNTELTVLN